MLANVMSGLLAPLRSPDQEVAYEDANGTRAASRRRGGVARPCVPRRRPGPVVYLRYPTSIVPFTCPDGCFVLGQAYFIEVGLWKAKVTADPKLVTLGVTLMP